MRTRTTNNKIRKTVLTMALGLTVSLSATAQVFDLDDENYRAETNDINGEYSNVIVHGETHDQTNYVPIGSGSLMLAALGGAYLMHKKTNA